MRSCSDSRHASDNCLAAHQLAINADALAEDVEVRAGEETNAHTALAQHPLAQRRCGTLAIRACHMDELQLAARPTELLEHPLEAVPALLRVLVTRGRARIVGIEEDIADRAR
eukprot:scaffold37494_cov31-Tisochrysis_lutea.AAC.2